MERISIARCRELIVQPGSPPLSDEEIVRLRDMVYSLAGAIADAFVDLGNIDQSAFEPPGDVIDQFEQRHAEFISNIPPRGQVQ